MALNVISNFAANVAHRNLTMSDAAASNSLIKLSSGQRVVSAKDDAASLAIGSRLRAEVVAMRTASVNAGQAGSMLQIADGALATISDILVRMKELAVQASSGQFSSTERSVLDSEFQALKNEISRIANDTEFNGTQLIAGTGNSVTLNQLDDLTVSGKGMAITADPTTVVDQSAFRLSYAQTTAVAQIDDLTVAGTVAVGDIFTVNITDNAVGKTFTASYTSTVAGGTATQHNSIRDGLITAINNVVGNTVTASANGNGVVRLTADTAGNPFTSTATENSASGTFTGATQTANVTGGDFLTARNITNGTSVTVDAAPIIDAVVSTKGSNLTGTQTAKVSFGSLGIDVTLNANFDRASSSLNTTAAATATTTLTVNGSLTYTRATTGINQIGLKELQGLGAYNSTTGILTLNVASSGAGVATMAATTGLEFSLNGGAFGGTTADFDAAGDQTIRVRTATSDQILATITANDIERSGATDTISIDMNELLFGADVTSGSSTTSFNYKVGTGNSSFDNLSFSINAASASALKVNSNDISTAALADDASTAVSAAIDTLNQSRSDIGAAQNRLTFASSNLSSAIENAEAARSTLLDLDVAAEISTFTAKQILVQTGVSMLAQANQLPQNLLRLFQ